MKRDPPSVLKPPSVDCVARIAQAWDCEGDYIFQPPFEHRAILALAGLAEGLEQLRWRQLRAEERRKIAHALLRIYQRVTPVIAWCFALEGDTR